MNKLMNLDPKERLGSKGIDEVKNHPFLEDINWSTIMEEKGPF